MIAVLISIQPKWCELIAHGKKTLEIRKTKPKLKTPFKCYIYETQGKTDTPWICEDGHEIFKGRGQVIGEFICKGIMQPYNTLSRMAKESCLTEQELLEYSKGKELYGWRIADLKIYDKPKELSEFKKPCIYEPCINKNFCSLGHCCPQCKITRPPQSWCYAEEK